MLTDIDTKNSKKTQKNSKNSLVKNAHPHRAIKMTIIDIYQPINIKY